MAMKKNREIIIVSLILAALLAIVFREVIFSDYVFTRRDVARYYYPLRKLAADTFRQGELPLWNPYLFCGTPLHAPIQNSIFYPLSLIYYLMDFAKGLSLFIILHIFLCGLFTYIFMRSSQVSRQGSFLAALTFTFSGYIMSAISLTISLNSVTWFPLAMLMFFKGLKSRRYRFSVFLGLVLTLMFLAGDPSIFAATFAIIFLASGYLFIERMIKARILDGFLIFNLLSVSGIFFLLSAFQILPAIEYYTQTIRFDMSLNNASMWSVPYSDLLSLIIPYFNDTSWYYNNYMLRQSWLDNYYLGITTILIAGFALSHIRKSRLTQFLCAIGLISLAGCLGKYFILYPLVFKAIPLARIVRYPVRFFFIFTFSVCALAGIGYDRLKESITLNRFKAIAKAFLVTAFLSSLLVIALSLFSERIAVPIIKRADEIYKLNPSFNIVGFPSLVLADIFNLRRSLLYIASFGLFIFLCSRIKGKKTFMVLAIFLIVGLDLLLANTGYEPIIKVSSFKEPTDNIKYTMEDKSLFRITPSPYSVHRFDKVREKSYDEGIKSAKDRFVTNRMMEFGIYDMWGYDSTVLKRNLDIARPIYKGKDPAQTNLLNLLSVKYITSHSDMHAYGYEKVNQTPYASVYLNSRVLPKALLLRKVIVMDRDEDILEYMLSKKFNPKKEIMLEERIPLPKKGLGAVSRRRKDEVDIVKYTPGECEISVVAREPAFLLLNDTYYPGWKAYIDGRLERIYRADYFLRAVKIPEGKHSVRFVYDPLSFKIGVLVSSLSILILLLYIAAKAIFCKKGAFLK